MKYNEYKCDYCKDTFIKGVSEQEAISEKNRLFPREKIEDMALVCDGCFKKIMAYNEHPIDEHSH